MKRHLLRCPNDFPKESGEGGWGYLTAGRARDGAGVSHVESSRDKAVPDNFAMTKLGSAQQDILITALPTKRKMKSDKMCKGLPVEGSGSTTTCEVFVGP